MKETVIISACRTAIGKFQGSLTPFSAVDLGAFAVREAVHRAGIDPALVDEVIMGNVVPAGLGQNPARQAGLKGGLSNRVAAMTINKVSRRLLHAAGIMNQNATDSGSPRDSVCSETTLVIPLLFLCESLLDARLREFVSLIVRSGVVPKNALPALRSEIARTGRWRDSWLPEIMCLLATVLLTVFAAQFHLSGKTGVADPIRAMNEFR
ncbi:MAG: hypothetical protein ACLQVL_20245, partial [Terriglobia bacterium]